METKMNEAARAARNAYKRKWAKENPDKVKAATRRYWERKALKEVLSDDKETASR